MAIIIQLDVIKILYILNISIVSVFTGDEKRNSFSLLKYNTEIEAAIEESNIIKENVI
jgi:hypothetical protein